MNPRDPKNAISIEKRLHKELGNSGKKFKKSKASSCIKKLVKEGILASYSHGLDILMNWESKGYWFATGHIDEGWLNEPFLSYEQMINPNKLTAYNLFQTIYAFVKEKREAHCVRIILGPGRTS